MEPGAVRYQFTPSYSVESDRHYKLTHQIPNPQLPHGVALFHFDYQQKLELVRKDMIAAQKFTRVKTNAKTIVTDTLWSTIDNQKFKSPQVVQKDDFQNVLCCANSPKV